MRDPLTKLAIVDPASIDVDICKLLPDVFMIPGRLAVVHYVGRVTKKTRFGTEKRVLIVSDKCVVLCTEDGSKKRCIRISNIQEIIVFQDLFAALRVPTEYDVLFKLTNAGETDYCFNILQVIHRHSCTSGEPLRFVALQGSYKDLPMKNVAALNLSKPSGFIGEMVEFRILRQWEAKFDAVEEFLTRPPPPPTSSTIKPAVAEISEEAALILRHPLFDGTGAVSRQAADEQLDATGSSTATPTLVAGNDSVRKPPFTAPEGTVLVSKVDYEAQLSRLQKLQNDLAAQQSAHLTSVHRFHRLQQERQRETTNNEMSPSAPLMVGASPTPHDGSTPPAAARTVGGAAAWASPQDKLRRKAGEPSGMVQSSSPQPNELSPAIVSRVSVLEAELVAMREELRAANERSMRDAAHIHQQKELIQQLHERRFDEAPPARSTQQQPAMVAPTTASFSSPDRAVGEQLPPVRDAKKYSPHFDEVSPERTTGGGGGAATTITDFLAPLHGLNAAPPAAVTFDAELFEATLQGKPLNEKIVVRQYQIDRIRDEINKMFAADHSYNAATIAQKQEALMFLAKRHDEDLAERRRLHEADEPSMDAAGESQQQQQRPIDVWSRLATAQETTATSEPPVMPPMPMPPRQQQAMQMEEYQKWLMTYWYPFIAARGTAPPSKPPPPSTPPPSTAVGAAPLSSGHARRHDGDPRRRLHSPLKGGSANKRRLASPPPRKDPRDGDRWHV